MMEKYKNIWIKSHIDNKLVKSQAMKIVSEKIPELMNLSKTGMLKREILGNVRTNLNSDDPNVVFRNHSWIKIVSSTDNARSARANLLILDEFRMVKPEIYTLVLRRFLSNSRQPGFLSKPEYKKRPELQERNQEIFLTSCYYKYNWSYQRYKVFLKNMLEGKGYFVVGLPYQVAIKEGLSSKEQLLDEIKEDDFDEIALISWCYKNSVNPIAQGCVTKRHANRELPLGQSCAKSLKKVKGETTISYESTM